MARSSRSFFSSLAAMRLLRISGLLLTMLVLYVPSSFADPITFVYQGTASGSIGGTNFSGAAFTITAFADTANRQSLNGGFFIVHDNASISIAGLGTFTFTTALVTFVNNTVPFAGLGRTDNTVLLGSPNDPLLATWDMLSSIGPVGGTWFVGPWDAPFQPVLTSGGQLIFNPGEIPLTFTATVGAPVPEPTTLLLFGSGLAGVLGSRRVRRRFTKR